MKSSQVIDERQDRSERRGKYWLKWLCNPTTLKLLIRLGQVIHTIVKALIDLFQLLRD